MAENNNNLARLYTRFVHLLNALQSPFALLVRVYVSWVFLKSGWLKLSDWGQTVRCSNPNTACRCCRRTLQPWPALQASSFSPMLRDSSAWQAA